MYIVGSTTVKETGKGMIILDFHDIVDEDDDRHRRQQLTDDHSFDSLPVLQK